MSSTACTGPDPGWIAAPDMNQSEFLPRRTWLSHRAQLCVLRRRGPGLSSSAKD
ncbi:MAG: hypothetical protein ACYTF2_04760 [Planctomycetota bacterium]